MGKLVWIVSAFLVVQCVAAWCPPYTYGCPWYDPCYPTRSMPHPDRGCGCHRPYKSCSEKQTAALKTTGVNFSFARTFGSNMVLQRAPVRSRIWGYGINVRDQVTVTICGGREYSTITFPGTAGRPVWRVEMDPVEAGGPYTITATSAGYTLTLENVLFGDVWFCSGQSNMDFPVDWINNPQPDIDDILNYPNIRSFMAALATADSPQEDVGAESRNWAVPTPGFILRFSALCWLFGKNLYDKYQLPIGLIQSTWGGTRIEAWSPPEALNVCFPQGVTPDEGRNAANVLYNAMIHPFFPMPIFGAIWYQGESNAVNAQFYACAIKEMVKDWRLHWFHETDTMDEQFPFGEVQLAPFTKGGPAEGFSDIRWQQTFLTGFVPNQHLQRFFMAVAMDLPDFDSPFGPVHQRFKRQIANRLALGAFAIGYGDNSSGAFNGPFPTGFSRVGTNIVLTHTGFTLEQRGEPSSYIGYEVCCSLDATVYCPGDGTAWALTSIVSVSGPNVTITMPCAKGQFATGVRYSWRQSPCYVLEACPVYADAASNHLPAPSFVINQHIG